MNRIESELTIFVFSKSAAGPATVESGIKGGSAFACNTNVPYSFQNKKSQDIEGLQCRQVVALWSGRGVPRKGHDSTHPMICPEVVDLFGVYVEE